VEGGIPVRTHAKRRLRDRAGKAAAVPGLARHPAIVLAAMNTSLPVLLRISNAVRCVI
jgi:hypothetical protein